MELFCRCPHQQKNKRADSGKFHIKFQAKELNFKGATSKVDNRENSMYIYLQGRFCAEERARIQDQKFNSGQVERALLSASLG